MLTGKPKCRLRIDYGFCQVGVSDDLAEKTFWWRGERESLIGCDGGKMDREPIHQLWGIIQVTEPQVLHPSLCSSISRKRNAKQDPRGLKATGRMRISVLQEMSTTRGTAQPLCQAGCLESLPDNQLFRSVNLEASKFTASS